MPDMRILIIRLSAIGDVVQTMPVACAIKEHFPHSFVAWVVEERSSSLLRGHAALDELIVLKRGWLKSPAALLRLGNQLRRRRFDVALDVQSLSKSALLGVLSGARRRIGFAPPAGREISPGLNTELVRATAVHMVERYLELLKPLGVHAPAVHFAVPESEPDRLAAVELLQRFALSAGFAIINPGAAWPSKLWPAERYAAVARHLGEHWRLPTLLVWSGAEERRLAERIAAAGDGHARVAPPTSLGELAALARRCRLFISADTGPLHLAAAVGAACIGLYGPWPAERHGPYGVGNIALQQMRFEGPTRRRRHASACYMESISTEMVCQACDQLLSGLVADGDASSSRRVSM